jgi:NADH-quinone oxidoreductase subunit J
MTPIQIFFLIAAAATLLSAVMVVSARQIMHAALWLVLTLSGVAVLFVTLETGFFAVIQVVVYVGALAILIIFAVMLTRVEQRDEGRKINSAALLSGLAALGVTGSLIFALRGWQAFSMTRGTLVEQEIDNLAALGQAFVSPDAYAIPFEVASVLLIGALIGALYVANEQKSPREGA